MQGTRQLLRATPAEILGWAESEPWGRAMAACQQDSGWHAEGDVWTHTRMVVDQLLRLEEWERLTAEQRFLLIWTALFHDAGKPETTCVDPETGRTRSPRHALVGSELARRVLRDLGCDVALREQVAALVRYHGRPPFLLEKGDPESEVISLSWLANNYLLYLFAVADTRGRICATSARPEELLQLWREVAEEQRCLYAPYPFANDVARFRFFRGELSNRHYTPHDEPRCTVTLMSGLPGAGKDTWLRRHRPGLPMVSLDSLRDELKVDPEENQGTVIQAGREQCREHLRAGRDYAFNATNITRQVRTRWIDLAADYQARIEIVYLEPPWNQICEQNSRRPDPVPTSVMTRLLHRLEPPTITEGHDLKIIAET